MDRETDHAQADAIALVSSLQRDDHHGFANMLLGMTATEQMFALMSLAASLASCADALGLAAADAIRKPPATD
ncbi:hypothetical protein [Microbacterium capsulatum]|uniref:Uncharacterized protein n=1 Tax=Microbacterium capsulatum TaxID=3041921 RepID=A0ABU0XDW5_9MICO|nr:hypothetical protein [Microbacterium sp. ASV81]MDQ4213268.1 hypothetical protein [Microbacterium sp. ASV81]